MYSSSIGFKELVPTFVMVYVNATASPDLITLVAGDADTLKAKSLASGAATASGIEKENIPMDTKIASDILFI